MMLYLYQCPKCGKVALEKDCSLGKPGKLCPYCKPTKCLECGGYHKDQPWMDVMSSVMIHKEML